MRKEGIHERLIATPNKPYALVAVCADGDWNSCFIVFYTMSPPEVDRLKRSISQQAIEHLKSGQGKRVNFIQGYSLNNILEKSEVLNIKLPEELKRTLKASLDDLLK